MLVMEVGGGRGRASRGNCETQRGDKKSNESSTKSTAEYNATHPRYRVSAYGCSSNVYKVVTEDQNSEYAYLLKPSTELFAEHSRQDRESVSAVMQQKPVLEFGDDSYNWLEDPSLTNGRDIDEKAL